MACPTTNLFLNTSTLVSPEQWWKPWLFAVHIWLHFPVIWGLQLCKPLEGVLWSNQDFMGCHECRILNVVSSPWSRRQELQHHVTSKSEKKSEQSWVPNSLKSDVFFGDTCDLGFLWQWHHHRDHRDRWDQSRSQKDQAIPFENQSVLKVARKKHPVPTRVVFVVVMSFHLDWPSSLQITCGKNSLGVQFWHFSGWLGVSCVFRCQLNR